MPATGGVQDLRDSYQEDGMSVEWVCCHYPGTHCHWTSGHSLSLAHQEGNSHESQHPHDLCQHHFYTSFCLHHPYTLFCTLQCPAEQSLDAKSFCSRSELAPKAFRKPLAVPQADIGNPEGESTPWFMSLCSMKLGCNCVCGCYHSQEHKQKCTSWNECMSILALSTPV